ncbi:hypothetical protein HQ535_07635 [bacterium]|nr:hypothetical protein [bacterium]
MPFDSQDQHLDLEGITPIGDGLTHPGRAGMAPLAGGAPAPQMLVHPDRRIDSNIRKVREFADEHGEVTAIAHARSGYRMLRHIRDQIGDNYTAEFDVHDPQTDPERFRRRQHVLRVARHGGRSPEPRPAGGMERWIASRPHWSGVRLPLVTGHLD